MACTHALVGWKRAPPAEPFIKVVFASAPPCVPEPTCSAPQLTAPCGVRLQLIGGSALCSTCHDVVPHGVRLSNNELMCIVCSSATFDRAEHTPLGRGPPVALFCKRDANGLLQREDLSGVQGRTLEMLLSIRPGDPLRCCGCMAPSIAGRVGAFDGFCLRRNRAVLRLPHSAQGSDECGVGAVVCVRAELLRRPDDELVAKHERMLVELLRLGASASTLRCGSAAVQAAHTLCGTHTLERVTRAIEMLGQRDAADMAPPPATHVDAAMDDRLGPLFPDGGGGGRPLCGPAGMSMCTNEAYPTAHGLRSPGLAAKSFR